MKKAFGLLFVAGLFTFASCSEGETTTETYETETTVETPVEIDSTVTTDIDVDTTVID